MGGWHYFPMGKLQKLPFDFFFFVVCGFLTTELSENRGGEKERDWRPLNSRGRNGGFFHCQIFSAPLHGHMEPCVIFLL